MAMVDFLLEDARMGENGFDGNTTKNVDMTTPENRRYQITKNGNGRSFSLRLYSSYYSCTAYVNRSGNTYQIRHTDCGEGDVEVRVSDNQVYYGRLKGNLYNASFSGNRTGDELKLDVDTEHLKKHYVKRIAARLKYLG